MKYLLFIITLLLLISCDDESENRSLPPITDTGENTFGCKVNGEVWIPDNAPFCGFEIPLKTFRNNVRNSTLRLSAQDCIFKAGGINKMSLFFYLNDESTIDSVFLRLRQYDRDDNTSLSLLETTINLNDNKYFNFEYNNSSTIEIISGVFELDLIDTITGAEYEIREGRLDVVFVK